VAPPALAGQSVVLILALVGVAVVVAVIISLFVRRHGESDAPEPGWTPTNEVFKDPGTDRLMRVWVDRVGERHYVPDVRR
jgi:hypothetical protein